MWDSGVARDNLHREKQQGVWMLLDGIGEVKTAGQDAAPLAGLRVVELPGTYAVRYCAHMFANLGATVTKVLPEEEPSTDASIDVLAEAVFVDQDKSAVAVPFAGDISALQRLVLQADVLLTSEIPEALAASGVLTTDGAPENPGLVLGLITDFPFDGPYADYEASSLTGWAASGYVYINGDPDRAPLRGMTYHLHSQTGLSAFLAIMAALLDRRRSGVGQCVSTSVMQTIAPLHEWTTVRYTHGGFVQGRLGNRYSVGYPIRLYRGKENYWCVTINDQEKLDLLLALAGHAELVGDPRFETEPGRNRNAAAIDEAVQPWFTTQDDADIVAQFEPLKITGAPARDITKVLDDPIFREREFWRESRTSDGRTVTVPGRPARFLATAPGGSYRRFSDGSSEPERGPLAGLRVIDVTTGWSGPHGTRLLGDLGADLIRVEPPWLRGTVPPDDEYVQATNFYMNNEPSDRYWMTSGQYNKWAYNKRNLAVRLNTTEGKEVLAGLVREADVIIENFSSQAWEKLGVTYEWLRSVNPAIIAVSMPGYGRWGPGKYRVSWGNQIEAYIGADSLMGYEDGEPHMNAIAWPDPVAGMHAAAHALVGIWEREMTGEGRFIEIAQAEGALNFMAPAIAKYGLTGVVPRRIGNRDERAVPQGVYPCAGEERWIAITVTGDDTWGALCRTIGRDDLAADPGLANVAGRRARHDELDEAIAAWTSTRDRWDATRELQAAGVAAFPAYDARDIVEDESLWATNTLVRVGDEPLPGFPYQLSRTPPAVHRPIADVGEHNREVLLEVGFSPADVDRFESTHAVENHPTL